jgi:hypothetical protein
MTEIDPDLTTIQKVLERLGNIENDKGLTETQGKMFETFFKLKLLATGKSTEITKTTYEDADQEELRKLLQDLGTVDARPILTIVPSDEE